MSRRRGRALVAACVLVLGVPAAALGAGHAGWVHLIADNAAATPVAPQPHDSMDQMMGGSMDQMMGGECLSMMSMSAQACRSMQTAGECLSMMPDSGAPSEQCESMMSGANCASMMENPTA